ncbi:MAG TPA: hypothetical protein VNA28_17325 [Solirubrobacteraceae bacterium]|nr:hypothetical protein [Solirubrobacteraceae bacterium]
MTSSKVKNGALLAKDFKAGQLPAGPQGAPGAPGAIAASAAFQVQRNAVSPPTLTAGTTTTLVNLPLVAGKYVLIAKLDLSATVAPVTVTCRLQAGASSDKVSTTIAAAGASSCNMQTVAEFAAAGPATLTIETPGGSSVNGGDAKLTAIRVGSLQSSEVTP